MDFTIVRGDAFSEDFNFKNPDGSPANLTGMEFEILAEHGLWAVSLQNGTGLTVSLMSGKISVAVPADWTYLLPYSYFKYTLAYTFQDERTEVTSGMVTVI